MKEKYLAEESLGYQYYRDVDDEDRSSFQRQAPPKWKNSSVKTGRSIKQIKKNRKRNKMKQP